MADGQVLVDKTSMNLLIMQFDGLKQENEALKLRLEDILVTQEQASQGLQTVTDALHKVQYELSLSENHAKVQKDLLSLKDTQLQLAKKAFLDLYNQMREMSVHVDVDIGYAYPALRPGETLAFSKEEIAQMNYECEKIRAEISNFSTVRAMSASGALQKTAPLSTLRSSSARVDKSGLGFGSVESADAALRQKSEELALVKAERDALQRDNRELSLQVRKFINEAAAQRSALASSQANSISRDEYLLEKYKLEKVINELRNSLDSTRQTADMLQQTLDQEKERYLRLQEDRNTIEQQLFQTQEELEQLKVRFMTKSRHFDQSSASLETHARTLEEDNQKLAEHITQLTAEYQQLVQQAAAKDEALGALEKEKEQLLGQVAGLTADIETLGAEFQAREQELDVATSSLEQLLNRPKSDFPVQTDIMADQGVIVTLSEFNDAKKEIRERGKQRIIHKVTNILNLGADKGDITMEGSLRVEHDMKNSLSASLVNSGTHHGTVSEDDFISKLMILKTDMAAKLAENSSLRDGIAKLSDKNTESEAFTAKVTQRAEDAEREVESLRAEIKELQAKTDLLRQQNERSLQELALENDSLTASIVKLKQRDDTSRTHNQDIMRSLEEKTISLDKAQQELNWNQVKIGQLERRVGELEEELTNHLTGGAQNDKHIEALKKAYEAKIQELNAEIDQRDADMNRLLKEQMARYAEQRAELEAVVRAPLSRVHNQGLLDEIVHLQKLYEEANSERYKLLAEIRAKETECDELSTKNVYISQERDRLQTMLDEANKAARTIRQDESEQHSQTLSNYERRLREKDAMIDELYEKANRLESEKKTFAADYSDIDSRLKATLATSSELAEQLADYKARVDGLESENRQYITEITMQKAKISSTRAGESEKDRLITTLQDSIKNYERELSSCQSEIESLKGLITTRTRFLEAANNELAGIKKKHDMDTDKFKTTIKQLNNRITELDMLLSNSRKDETLILSYKQKIRDLEVALKSEREALELSRKTHKAEQKQEFRELEEKMKQLSYAVEERDALRKEKKLMMKEIQRLKDDKNKMMKDHEEAMMGLLRNDEETEQTDRDNTLSRERFDYYKAQARKYKDLYKRAFSIVEKMKAKEKEMKQVIIQLEDKLFEMGVKRNDILITMSNKDSSRANYSATGESQSESQTRGSSRQSSKNNSRTNSRSKQRRPDSASDYSKASKGKADSPIMPINIAYRPNTQR